MKLDKLIKKSQKHIENECKTGLFAPRIYIDYRDLFNDDGPLKASIQEKLYVIDFNHKDPCINQNIHCQHTQLINKKIPHVVAALAQFAGVHGKGAEAEKEAKELYKKQGNLQGFKDMIHVLSIRVYDGEDCYLLMNKINDDGLTEWEFCSDNYENIYH